MLFGDKRKQSMLNSTFIPAKEMQMGKPLNRDKIQG